MTTLSPTIEAVKFWDDGWRLGLIVKRGRKWLRILDCGSLRVAKLPADEPVQPEAITTKRIVRLLDRRRRMFRRCGVGCAQSTVKEIIKELSA